MDRRRGRHLRAVHDDPRWYYRHYCHSPPAERLWREPDERAVGAHSLHPGARGGDAAHRLSLPTFGPETPLPDSSCGLHNRLGSMWTLRESAHVDLLPRGAGSDGCIYVAAGHYPALDRIPPNERGTAMGALGVPILLAPAFGPTLGGYIVTYLGWQLIFFINLPIGILGIILGVIFLREGHAERRARFDLPGFLFAAIGLASLLYGMSDASTAGWGSTKVLSFLVVGVLSLAIFVVVELNIANRGGQPLLDLRVFANAPFTTSNITSMLVTFALYGGLFLIPVYLQNLRGLSAYQAGLLLLPQAFASMVAAVVGGRLVDRFGVRAVVIPGLIILGGALWLLSSLSLNTPYGTLQFWLIGRSLALGFCFQPLAVSALSEIRPRQLPQATSVNTTVRFVISSFAVAVMATLVQTQTAIHYAHLAEQVTPSSPLGQLLPGLQALFMLRGASASAAFAAAIQVISGLVQRQASILAFQDAFHISVALTVVAIIAACFIRYRRPQPTIITEREEEVKAKEEAMLAV